MAELDLNRVVAKYQQLLANAQLQHTIAETNVEQAREELTAAQERIDYLENIIKDKDEADSTSEKTPPKKK